MNEFPYGAMTQIGFERPRIVESKIEARVRISLYFRRKLPAPPVRTPAT